MWPRLECQSSSQLAPNHLSTVFALATMGLNKITPHLKSSSLQRQTILQGTSTRPRCTEARHGVAERRASCRQCPHVRHCHCSSGSTMGAEMHGQEKQGVLPGLSLGRENSSSINTGWETAGSLPLPGTEIYMAGGGGVPAHRLEQLDTLGFMLHLG